jgi:hypothetical protein
MRVRAAMMAAVKSARLLTTLLILQAMAVAAASADGAITYPDVKGQWRRIGSAEWTPAGQKPPLTAEYQVIYDDNLKDQASGGHGTEPSFMCTSPGMPRIMLVYTQMEIVITPATTYILIDHINDNRRIFTDGRDWPSEIEPSFHGYSIGRWIDTDGDGRYDTLDVETRHFKGPRAYDTTGLPLHSDNETVVKERIRFDKADPNTIYDDVTTIDHALTGPWTVTKTYRRDKNPQPEWLEMNCAENNAHIRLGKENYIIGAEGLLMPAKKDQAPPDLKYFKRPSK